MENGRIEPLRAPPVHREVQLCLQLSLGPIYIDFPLDANPKDQILRPLEASGGPKALGLLVALKPNRK